MLRGRPGSIRTSEPFQANGRGTNHVVNVSYLDDYQFPRDDTVIWELEPSREFLEATQWPNIRDHAPDDDAEYHVFLDAIKWSSLESIRGILKGQKDTVPLISPWSASVQVEDYQLLPVLRALSMPRVNLLLADDVGLGKTIQAGLITCELMTRRNVRRIIIVCPASLQNQWKQEMQEKFHLDFTVIDGQEIQRIRQEHGSDVNPWSMTTRAIVSMDYLKQELVLTDWQANNEARRKTAPPSQRLWDLLIVDEAHNVSPQNFTDRSDRTRMMDHIREEFEHTLFLTATPHNGYAKNFTGLLELLDPYRFTQRAQLTKSDREHLDNIMIRRLKTDIDAQSSRKRFASRRLHPMRFTYTDAERQIFQLLADYQAAAQKALPKEKSNLVRFATSLLKKRLFSSMYAFARTWQAHIKGNENTEQEVKTAQTKLIEDLADDAEVEARGLDAARTTGGWLIREAPQLNKERQAITQALAKLGFDANILTEESASNYRKATDSKADYVLRHLIQGVKKDIKHGVTEDHDALVGSAKEPLDRRVILFTEYRDTQRYLAARLAEKKFEGNLIGSLFGGMSRQARDDVKQVFNERKNEVRILLATDAASEGLNLQSSCSTVQHYDIPWNPMRLEQRNGRVDRHGQPEPFVDIYHYHSTQLEEDEFLAFVVQKVNQVRADLGVVGDIFDSATTDVMNGVKVSTRDIDSFVDAVRKMGDEEELKSKPIEEAEYKKAMQRFNDSSAKHGLTPENLQRLLTVFIRRRLNTQVEEDSGMIRVIAARGRAKTLLEQGVLRGGKTPWMVFDGNQFLEDIGNNRTIFRNQPDKLLIRLGTPITQAAIQHYRSQIWGHHKEGLHRWTMQSHKTDQDVYIGIDYTVAARNDLQEVIHSEVATWWYRWTPNGWVPLDAAPALRGTAPVTAVTQRSAWMERIGQTQQTAIKLIDDRITKSIKHLHSDLEHELKESGDQRGEEVIKDFNQRRQELVREGKSYADRLVEELERAKNAPIQVKLIAAKDFQEAGRRMAQERVKQLEERLTKESLARWNLNQKELLERLDREKERYQKHVHPKRYKMAGPPEFLRVGMRVIVPEGTA